MAKLTLTDLASLQNETSAITSINTNNADIETAMENTLSRDGTSPNTMLASLDMNSQRIINLPAPINNTEPVRLQDVTDDITVNIIDNSNVISAYIATLLDDSTAQIARNTILETGTSGYLIGSDGTDADWVGFLQAGTGASTRTWQTKLREVEVSVEDFGAVGDADNGGTTGTDDTTSFQEAIDYVNSIGGGIVRFHKRHLIDSNLTIKANVQLRGPIEMPGLALPVSTASYDNLLGVLYLNSAATITTQWAAGVQNCYILRKGLETPFADQTAATAGVAAFAGTAITIGNHDCRLSHLLILGFAQAVSSGGAAAPARLRFDYVAFDCTAGILVDSCADICHMNFCHGFPYLTTGRGFTDATLTRSGTAFEFQTQNDWGKFTNCFAFGYAVGFDLDSVDSCNLVGCGADYPESLSSTAIGFRVGSGSLESTLIGCQAAALGTGYHIENGLSSSNGGVAKLLNCTSWGIDTTHVSVITGRLIASGCSFRNGTTGISAASGAGALTICNNEFESLTTPLSIDATPKALSKIYGNRTRNCTNALDEFVAVESNTAATGPIKGINTNDAASVQVARFDGDRATPTDNDTAFVSYYLSDDLGGQTEFARFSYKATDVSATTEDAQAFWSLIIGGSLTDQLLMTGTTLSPVLNDGLALGSTTIGWSDLFFASGGVINWDNGDVTVTHSANTLTFAGATSGYLFDALVQASRAGQAGRFVNTTDNASVQIVAFEGDRATPASNDTIFASYLLSSDAGTQREAFRQSVRLTSVTDGAETTQVFWGVRTSGSLADEMILTGTILGPVANDGLALGSGSLNWSDLFLASGGVINFNNGDVTLTHIADMLTLGGGSFSRGAPVTKTADFTLAANENWVINDRAATNTVTLPSAASFVGREITMSTIQAQAVVSASSNVVPRTGGAAGTAILPATDGAWATLVSDGTNWVIMAGTP